MNENLTTTLQWLAGGGGAVLAALWVSWWAEYAPHFQAQSAAVKRAAMAAVCAALSVGAWAVLKYVPPETLSALAEPFRVVVIGLSALLTQQAWHATVNKHRG